MSRRTSKRPYFFAGLATGLGLAAYNRTIRPWMFRWGATDDEASRPLPGDDLVPAPFWGWTHAITIDAPARNVWPWIIQMGYGRGGWYTFDPLYEVLHAADFYDGASADRIIPELQNIAVGDELPLAPGLGVPVVALEPNRHLLVYANGDPGAEPGAPFDAENFLAVGWLWYLEPMGPNVTRLINRCRLDYSPSLINIASQSLIIQPFGVLLDRKMLSGIKQRAERMSG